MTVLTVRALNRATLARQLLLERADLTVLDAVAWLCGLQAQEPQEPFVGLWSRLSGFRPEVLSDLLTGRQVVRAHVMRRTMHLLTADDARAWRPRHDSMLRQRALGVYRRDFDGVDLAELAQAGHTIMSDGEPRTMTELARALADRWPTVGQRPLGEMVLTLLPTTQVPPRGLWRTKGGARYTLLTTWLGSELTSPPDEDLVRRYLAAFGPATTADLRAWCGLSGLPAAVTALRDELTTFRDERGRELLDLPDAPRPDPDTPAPARFLPAFDNAILGYQNRTRIIDDEHRGLSVAGQRVVLVDGRVSATWTVDNDTVVVNPLRRFTPAERDEVMAEAEELSFFLSDKESRQACLHPV